MKEQDIIHTIKEQTNDLKVPDSISPEAIKKMLDEHTASNEDRTNVQKKENAKSYEKRNHYIRRGAIAACAAFCLIGSLGISSLLSRTDKDAATKSSVDQMEESAEANADSVAYDNHETSGHVITESNTNETDLVYQSRLQSPASYEEYYETLKSAYDDYYDRLSTVTTDDAINGESGDYGDSSDIAVAENVDESVDMAMEQNDSSQDFAASDKSTSNASRNATSAITADDTGSSENSEDFSTTNTQEKTVDEGDIIKTDGQYIYKVISALDYDSYETNYKLTVTKADNGNLSKICTIDLEQVLKKSGIDTIQFQEFYLYHDQLIFLYNKESYSDRDWDTSTYIVVYDLTDKAHPTMAKTLSQSGWYGTSRISDGYLYTISDFNNTSLDDKNEYRDYIPFIGGNPIACKNIYYPDDILMETTHVITSLNLEQPTAFTDSKAIPTTGYEYYVSDSAIFLYAATYADVSQTEIMRVDYKDGILTVGNSAVITGYLYDTFALNEYNGYLRIVATIPANNMSILRSSSIDFDTNVQKDVNALYILDHNMELTGKIAGIAPGETIYSARFWGDTGYFVTYKNMDPLFSVDLSDPSNPTIIGALKIPGFSEYLHFYDEDHLLGIGIETDPKTQEFLGVKLSMFDISDPASVTEQDKYIIENSEYSEALYNHKAIMIDPQKNIFGFLYTGFSTPNREMYSYYDQQNIYATFTYDKDQGFIKTASYQIDDTAFEYNSVRGVYIGDYFYLATNASITSYRIGSEDRIASVYFEK